MIYYLLFHEFEDWLEVLLWSGLLWGVPRGCIQVVDSLVGRFKKAFLSCLGPGYWLLAGMFLYMAQFSLSLPFSLSLSGVSSCRASPRELRLQRDSLDFLTAWQLGSQNAKGEAARTRLSLKLALCNFCHPWLVRISRGVSSVSREREVVPTSWRGEKQIICSHL